jgi:transposase InsO family protein
MKIAYLFSPMSKLRKIFAVYGICNELVSDNGSQFVSEEFKSYLEELGIKHTRITPYWARANGLVENFNKVLQCAIQMSDIPKDIKKLSNEDCLFIFTNVTLV